MSAPLTQQFPSGVSGREAVDSSALPNHRWFGDGASMIQPSQNTLNSFNFDHTSPLEIDASSKTFGNGAPSFAHERPLLEELGVNPYHIYLKTVIVINPLRPIDNVLMEDADLAGPLTFVSMLGTGLLFQGKLQYGHLFGLLFFGSFGLYLILNLMSQRKQIDYLRTLSIVGYSMLPMVILAGLSVFISLRGWSGVICGLGSVVWCAQTSTRFFVALLDMHGSKWLISYPVIMYYCIFVLVTVF
jgi:protein YIPF5/7